MSKMTEAFGKKLTRPEDLSIETQSFMQAALARRRARDLAVAHDWRRFEEHELLRPAGKRGRDFVADSSSGRLYTVVNFDPAWDVQTVDAAEVDAYFENRAGVPIFLQATRRGEPQTLADLDRERAEARRRREEAAEAERARIVAMPRRPVTFAELAALPDAPTLAEAVRRVERSGGMIENCDGELVVEMNPKAPRRAEALAACRVLFAAQEAVLEALNGGGAEGLAERLPDVHPRAGGGVT